MTRFSVLFALAIALSPARAADAPDDEPTVTETKKKKKIRPFIRARKDKKDDASQTSSDDEKAEVASDDKKAGNDEAEEVWDMPAQGGPPNEGIWAWVERLEGEVPTNEQVKALEEMTEVEQSEEKVVAGKVDAEPAVAADPLFLDKVDASEFDIPIVVNDAVRHWVHYFAKGSGRKHYARYLKRSTAYRPMMYEELEKRKMPRDLVYLSMIESGYNAHAYSKAHAAGLWQFIPSTGRLYDLRIDYWVDERRDPEKATHAALSFLDELHRMFNDWELAFAAYNTGPGRVRRAVRDTGLNDYWKLRSAGKLHPETAGYVPKIMAAAIIGHHPERYGFTDIPYQDEFVYDTVKVDGSVDVDVLAKTAGVTTQKFQHMNPALRRWATPPESYSARVPKGTGKDFSEKLAKIPKKKRVRVATHTVRRGETLSGIASKYGVSARALAGANRVRNHNRIYVGMKLTIPGGASPAVASSRGSTTSRPSTHKVSRGDTLSGVASKYGTTSDRIKQWNGLKSDNIQVGQVLKVRAPQKTASRSSAGTTTTAATRTYTVRKGDSLGKIAARNGVSTKQLQAWNGIKDPSKIFVGQKLKIRGGSSAPATATSWQTHTVKSGDSLGKIASRYGCTVQQIQSWNKLRGTVIHPGQKLKIKA